ncbi:MAG TPA: hypothetical protein VIW03_12680, partial [Anaeromyxobacter sp.]
GDCKDLSLLVAGLLRALGHPATLALLRTDWDELPAELPGLGEFDHAIVHVPGPRPLWIDPTDPATPVGSLPSWDQGRLALVAARGTAALVRTPEAGPAENRIAVSREIALQDDGWARAAEERELRGSAASDLRRARRGAGSEDAKRSDERSALERLAAKKLLAASWDGIERPDAPVRVRLEAEESRWGLTRSNDAEAAVSPRALFSCLPSALTAKADAQAADDDERGGDAEEEEPAPRKAEMVLPQACSGEVRYRVVPPPGFRPRPLPERRARAVGPASFEATYSADAAGAVTVLYRAEVPRRRLSPGEADALRDGIAEVAVEEKIGFERTSTALLEAGRGRDALAEIVRLASGEPRAAAHRIRLALALLRLGMGEAARKEARRAVELEPESGWARRVLAHVLAHDLIGRFMRPGCDLPAAVAAQRKAAALDEGSAQARAQLAFFLLHGARCERGASGARPDEALAIYAAIREDGTKEHDEEYLRALLGARRFREAAELARDMEKGAVRSAGLVAALAATEGPDAAAREAARLSPSDRFAALQAATLQLVAARQYAAAARLVDLASAGAANAAQLQAAASIFGTLRPLDAAKLDPADPAGVPLRLFRLAATGDGAALRADVLAEDADTSGADEMGEALLRAVRRGWGIEIPPEVVVDWIAATVDVRVEGEGPLRRLRLAAPGAAPLVLYVVEERGRWRALATGGELGPLGTRAARLVQAGDLASA